MPKFKVGDRVRLLKERYDGNTELKKGTSGTVVNINTDGRSYGVEWDVRMPKFGHDCGKTAKNGYGYNLPENYLETCVIKDWKAELGE